jgi:ABC-type proline/glycine betaine transport system permease subunit
MNPATATFWDRLVAWFTTTETWTRPGGLVDLIREHLWVSVLSTVVAVAVTVPLAL